MTEYPYHSSRDTILGIITLFIIIGVFIYFRFIKYRMSSYYKATRIPFREIKREEGRYGEYLLYKELRPYEKQGAKLLFNAYIPKEDGETTEIDMIMLSARGIVVLESKDYSGWIFGNEKSRLWHQSLHIGHGESEKFSFYNPILQNRQHIENLKKFLGDNDLPIYSVVVFSNRSVFKGIEIKNKSELIYLCELKSTLDDLFSTKCECLNQNAIQYIYDKLYPLTQVSEKIKNQHIASIWKKNISINYPYFKMDYFRTGDEKEINTEDSLDASDSSTHHFEDVVEEISIQPKENTDTTGIEEYFFDGEPIDLKEDALEEDEPMPELKAQEEPKPLFCPLCNGKLVIRTATKGRHASQQFYGCSNYPKCKYIRNL